MKWLSLNFPAHLGADPRDVRRRLNALAASLGYVATATHSPNRGSGSAAALLVAIAAGDVKLTKREPMGKRSTN